MKKTFQKAARVEGGEGLTVSLELDTEKREVKAPADLVKALKAAPPAWDRWRELSYSTARIP